MYTCGVLFCGGCNPHFDRMDVFDDLKKHFSAPNCQVDFFFYQPDGTYNLVLLINGCMSECLGEHTFSCPKLLINNSNYTRSIALVTDILFNSNSN